MTSFLKMFKQILTCLNFSYINLTEITVLLSLITVLLSLITNFFFRLIDCLTLVVWLFKLEGTIYSKPISKHNQLLSWIQAAVVSSSSWPYPIKFSIYQGTKFAQYLSASTMVDNPSLWFLWFTPRKMFITFFWNLPGRVCLYLIYNHSLGS